MKEATWESEEDVKSKYLFLFYAPRICAQVMHSLSYFFSTLLNERLIIASFFLT